MVVWIGVIGILVAVVLLIRWSAHRSDEIIGFYDEEDSPVAETLLRTNEMKGNSML
ncbi:MAG: hypothetical protein WBV06_00855 [Acidimicrobiia bacterium]